MLAVILAGGKGTRLKPFTMTIPKPLLPLGDVPIIEVVLAQLANAGITRVAMTLGHMAHLFKASIGTGEQFGLQVDYYTEDEPLGTAGPLRLLPELDDDFLVMNGDLLTTLSYQALIAAHKASNAWGTIAAHRREVYIDYGVLELSDTNRLLGYTEKPTLPYIVSMGINVLSPHAITYIPPSGRFDMPDLMLAMHEDGKPVSCYPTDCYWQDIGRFDDYQQASEDFVADASRFLPPAT